MKNRLGVRFPTVPLRQQISAPAFSRLTQTLDSLYLQIPPWLPKVHSLLLGSFSPFAANPPRRIRDTVPPVLLHRTLLGSVQFSPSCLCPSCTSRPAFLPQDILRRHSPCLPDSLPATTTSPPSSCPARRAVVHPACSSSCCRGRPRRGTTGRSPLPQLHPPPLLLLLLPLPLTLLP